jgi:hypothetical protein
MKKISLILIILMLLPMTANASVTVVEQYNNYIVINVYDGMTNEPLEDVNVDVYYVDAYGNGEYICTVYRTDIPGSYITKERFQEGDSLMFYVLHNDYYMYTYEYNVPFFNNENDVPIFSSYLYRKGVNVTTSLPGIYSDIVGPADLGFRFALADGNCVFGAGMLHDIRRDRLITGPALILRSDVPITVLNYDIVWQTLSGFHYLFNFPTIYNDLNIPADGDIIHNVGIYFEVDCNISATVVEGYVESQLLYTTYTGALCLVYENGSLTYKQNYKLELYTDFATTYLLEYVDYTDLIFVTTTGTITDTGLVDYTLVEWIVIGAMGMFVIIAFILMLNQTRRKKI